MNDVNAALPKPARQGRHVIITHRMDGHGLPRMIEQAYALLTRDTMHVRDFLGLPQEPTVALGRQVAI